jgi:uncharacterized protein YwgA
MRLQKAAFFMCLFAKEAFFKFEEHSYGPYSHAIDICSRSIKEFQDYYNINSFEAMNLAKNNLISDNIQKQLDKFIIPIERAATFINSISDDKTLEIISTLVAIVKKQPDLDKEHILERFYAWSETKKRYMADVVMAVFDKLINLQIINQTLVGYEIGADFYNFEKSLRYCDAL